MYKSRDGSELAVIAATWELNQKVTFASLAPEFKSNPVKAWRNFGSRVGKGGGSPALKDPTAVLAHVNQRHPDPWDYARRDFYTWFRGRRGVRYYIHIDLAKSKDKAGVACVHREATGVVEVDFMHAHFAQPGKDIQFAELRERYIYGLHARGFHVQKVTFDQWNSVEMRQVLEGQGFSTDEISADKTTGPYDTLIELVLNNRLDYYNHPVFVKELEALQTTGTKYDHPKKGSKDVTDAVACAAFTAINDTLENPPTPPANIRVHRPGRRSRFTPQYERTVW